MIHTIVQIMITPTQVGHFPFDSAFRAEAAEMEFMAFQPVVAIMEKITTSMFP